MAGLRFTIAGTIFYIWCLLRCDKKPDLEHWKKTIITGILMISIGHGCLAWSEQFIPSGMAALVVATIPIWMILQDWLFDTKKSPDLLTVIGIVVGFSGVVLLYLFQSNFMARVFQLNLFSTR